MSGNATVTREESRPLNTQIVVARYSEDTSWLATWRRGNQALVYNKGGAMPEYDQASTIQLDNVGRESHTYLHHILNNYDKLADITIFLQGQINDLGNWVHQTPEHYIPEALEFGFSAGAYQIMQPQDWQMLKIEDDPKYREIAQKGLFGKSRLSFLAYAYEHLGCLPLLTVISKKGCFAASRRAIQSRSRDFYERLYASVSYHHNPIEGHYLERLWALIFSRNTLLTPLLRLKASEMHSFLNYI